MKCWRASSVSQPVAARPLRSFFLTRFKARRQLAREVVNNEQTGRLSQLLGLLHSVLCSRRVRPSVQECNLAHSRAPFICAT